MKTLNVIIAVVISISLTSLNAQDGKTSQVKKKVAVISIDTKGIVEDSKTICSMVQLELEKTNVFEVLDRYDVSDLILKNGIDVNASYGKNSLVKIGKLLNTDKMISGSIEKFGDKIIFIFRLIDVNTDVIEKTDVMEYINQQDQLQIMIRLSINNLLGIANDKLLVDLLANYDQPITSSKTSLKLNGPRVGATYTWGPIAKRMAASKSVGGYDMFPVSSMIGYQFEKQYLSSGDFQALVEFIPSINSLESGLVIPSLTGMLGFRFNKSGFEFGLGPVFRIVTTADGFYDEQNNWILKDVNDSTQIGRDYITQLDRRGEVSLSTGMIFAVGKTFKSGYLNLPVNIYCSPRKEGSIVGITLGFNVANRPKFKQK